MATTLAVMSLVSTVGGGLMQASAQRQQAKAQNSVAQYNARMQEYNAQRLKEQQKDTVRQANQQAMDAMTASKQQKDEFRRRLASSKARAAAGGVLTNTGSPLDNLIDEATQYNLAVADNSRQRFGNVERLLAGAGQQQFQAYMQGQEANLSRAQGRMALSAGKAASQGTILSGVSQMGSQYSSFKNAGLF